MMAKLLLWNSVQNYIQNNDDDGNNKTTTTTRAYLQACQLNLKTLQSTPVLFINHTYTLYVQGTIHIHTDTLSVDNHTVHVQTSYI